MKIFYSWQTDTDERSCKTLIQTALEAAASEVAEELEVDHDTKRVLGSPNIVDVIAEKIRGASVFVADVTLTGLTQKPDGTDKKQINSNVAVELGYALGVHGPGVVIKVMNAHYGEPGELPFDVRDRYPLLFTLSPDAETVVLRSVRSQLQKEFRKILTEHHEDWLKQSLKQSSAFSLTASTYNSAAYWSKGELLVDQPALGFAVDQPLIYLRFSPVQQISPLKNTDLSEIIRRRVKTLLSDFGKITRNSFGWIIYSQNGQLRQSTTQLFKSREIWGVATYFKENEQGALTLPCTGFKTALDNSIEEYSNLAKNDLAYSHARLEVGLVNIGGVFLAFPDFYWKPFHSDVSFEAIVDLNQEQAINEFRNGFYAAVYDEVGVFYDPD